MENQPTATTDRKISEGVAYFEEILKVMPASRTALEYLCVAYEQLGETEKGRHALVSLVAVLLNEGDIESAELLIGRLNDFPDADAQAAILRIRSARAAAALKAEPVKSDEPDEDEERSSGDRKSAIGAESHLVHTLRINKIIDDQLAETLLQRLNEFADAPGTLLISALVLLDKENLTLAETAAAFVADSAGVAPIPVEIYDCSPLRDLLPPTLVRVRGVLPFAKMGNMLLVATLNPLDAALCAEVEAAAKMPCTFYLAHPRAVEEIIDRLFVDEPVTAESKQ